MTGTLAPGDVAGIGPKMDPNAPTAWTLYIGTDDIEALTREVEAAGGSVIEFLLDGRSVAGAWEMNAMVPAEVPSYWQIYFTVEDVDAAHRTALDLGAHEILAPQDMPGGRFLIVRDPEGASFGLLRME